MHILNEMRITNAVVAVAQLYGSVHIVVSPFTGNRKLHILFFNLLLQGAIKDSLFPPIYAMTCTACGVPVNGEIGNLSIACGPI